MWGAAGGRLRPGHGEPSGTRPHLARTPISACLRPPASTKRVPTVYLGEGNHRPRPAHPRKATGAGARSGATKGSCRPESVLRGCPWGRLPPSTRWVSAGGSWPRSGPWRLAWPAPNTQVRLTWLAVLGWPWSPPDAPAVPPSPGVAPVPGGQQAARRHSRALHRLSVSASSSGR